MSSLFPANQANLLNWFEAECAEIFPKYFLWHAIGYAEIDTTLRTQIDILVPSHKRDVEDLPLIVPNGAKVYYIGFRTPDVALTGTTGNLLKVGTALTDVTPNIAVASNVIAASSTAKSVATPFDSVLATAPGATQYYLLCSNAGSTAAGTGVKVAEGKKRVVVDICYLTVAEPSRLEQLGYPSSY
jgi:hypothetical protein